MRIQAEVRRYRACIHARALGAQRFIIRREIGKITAHTSKVKASTAEEALQEAGRKARAFMAKRARPTEKVISDRFLDSLEEQLRGECEPLGPDAHQWARSHSNDEARNYVSLNLKVSDSGHVHVDVSQNDADARSKQAREILDMFENAR